MNNKIPYDLNSLKAAHDSGHPLSYIYFWGHNSNKGYITHHCMSQWFQRGFIANGIEYLTAEHFLMAQKALLFQDNIAYQRILSAQHPGEVKKIGREVIGFKQAVWDQHKFDIAVTGNHHKFTQNEDLKAYLVKTQNKVLVEASPVDLVWGVGLAKDDLRILDPNQWLGENLLGFALMQVRTLISQ